MLSRTKTALRTGVLVSMIKLTSTALPIWGQNNSAQMERYARAAEAAEDRKDFHSAVQQYRDLLKLLPNNPEIRSNLGVALYFDHQLDSAIAEFRRAMLQKPDLLAPHLFTGLALYRESKPGLAAAELEKAIRLAPADAIAHTWLGYAYFAQSRYEAAGQELQLATKLDSTNVDAWYSLGQSEMEIGKSATARLLANAPDSGRVWELSGEQWRIQGDAEKARKDFEQAVRRRPDVPELQTYASHMQASPDLIGDHSEEDRLYTMAHNAEEGARAAFERVIQLDPASYRAHQIAADGFVARGELEKAIDEYRAVLAQKPDLPGVHASIGSCLYRSGKLPDALKEYLLELDIQPDSAVARTDAGRVLVMMGEDEAAMKMLVTAMHLEHPLSETYLLMGKIDLKRNNFHQAIQELTKYVSRAKDDSEAYFLLSRAYREIGDTSAMEVAIDLYKKTSVDAKRRTQAKIWMQH